MATRQLAPVLRYIRHVSRAAPADDSDRALLYRFARHGDAEAFAGLVRRHGPMVHGVCRRVLRHGHDADDAFQAVFLLLVRKAGSLRRPEQLGPWLHGVAYRVSVKARALGLRRSQHQEPLTDLAAPPPADDLIWRDLRPVLDDAVRSLPAKYRGPFVLCYLQGLTHAEAARHFGCPPGTIATRLSRARDQLRARLVRRGVTLSAAALVAALATRAEAAVAPALLGTVLRAIAPTSIIPSHVTALTEGVCQAMLMEKLRFAVMALVAMAAAGALVMGYRSGATEPQDPPAAVRALPPIAPPAEGEEGWHIATVGDADGPATVFTHNFEIKAPSRRIGLLLAEAAERHRKDQALTWLHKELPRWTRRCKIDVKITMSGAAGATTFEFAQEPDPGQSHVSEMASGGLTGTIVFQSKVKSRTMALEGSLDRLLASALPHEITHTIFADYFGKPVVRWADEGGAVLSEDLDEQERHERLAGQIMNTPGRAIALRRLVAMKEYPQEPMSLFAEGYSVTRFLVGKKDNKTFLAFVKQGMDDGWDKAVKEHYGFRDVEALEDAWLADLRRQPKDEAKSLTPDLARPVAKATPEVVRQQYSVPLTAVSAGVPPVTALAQLSKDGKYLRLRELGAVDVPVERSVRPDGKGGEDTTLTYSSVGQLVERALVAADTPVHRLDGKRVDPKELPELLKNETPVLVSRDGKMVHPFHLRLIKEGTLIVAPPIASAPQPAPPLAPQR